MPLILYTDGALLVLKTSRGANEISTYISDYLTMLDDKGVETVDLYSDGCSFVQWIWCTVWVCLLEHSVHLSFCQVPRYIICLCGRSAVMRLHTGKTLEMFNDFLPLMGLRILSPLPSCLFPGHQFCCAFSSQELCGLGGRKFLGYLGTSSYRPAQFHQKMGLVESTR